MSWEGLMSILQENRDIAAAEATAAPIACPICGTVLQSSDSSRLFCPFTDHYFYPSD